MCSLVLTIVVTVVLGFGVIFTGTVSRMNIKHMFLPEDNWNGGFILAVGIAIPLNSISTFLVLKCRRKPLLEESFEGPSKSTKNTILKGTVGAMFFGLGWGMGHISPSSLFMNLQFGTPNLDCVFLLLFVLGQLIGFFIGKGIDRCFKSRVRARSQETSSTKLSNTSAANTGNTQNTGGIEKIVLSESKCDFISKKYVSDANDLNLSRKVYDSVILSKEKKGNQKDSNKKTFCE